MKKNLLIVLFGLVTIILVFFSSSKLFFYYRTMKDSETGIILKKWLKEKDPGLFGRCKVFVSFQSNGQISTDGKFSIISGELCGGQGQFWINNNTKSVECYLSYCGKNVGNKYCGDEIADKLCEQ